jgi:hypothetical protein
VHEHTHLSRASRHGVGDPGTKDPTGQHEHARIGNEEKDEKGDEILLNVKHL